MTGFACAHCGRALSIRAKLCAGCGRVAEFVPRAKRRGKRILAAVVVAIVFVSGVVGLVVRARYHGVAAVEKSLAAVFTIEVLDSTGVTVSQGSGFLAGSNGLAVSALHVLAGVKRAQARFSNGRIFDVLSVNASDDTHDAIVFRVGRRMEQLVEYPLDVAPLTLASEDRARVGERVTVIGSPEGLANTLTDGLVSALRDDGVSRLLQISAPISPGSSGGPVLDASGKVIGVVVQQNPEGQNLNFAQPARHFLPLLSARASEPLADFGARTTVPDEASLYDELFIRGNSFFRRSRYEQALERYELAIRVAPDSIGAVYNSAICLDQLGREKEAAARFRHYLELNPPSDDFRENARHWLASHAAILK